LKPHFFQLDDISLLSALVARKSFLSPYPELTHRRGASRTYEWCNAVRVPLPSRNWNATYELTKRASQCGILKTTNEIRQDGIDTVGRRTVQLGVSGTGFLRKFEETVPFL
jgi:hypothetical protein